MTCLSSFIGTEPPNLGSFSGDIPALRETPDLTTNRLTLSALLSAGESSAKEAQKQGSSLLIEGIPPVANRLVEKIRAWQYVDLADLLTDSHTKSDEPLISSTSGQILLIQSVEQVKKKKKQITDVASWTQAFAIYVAALASSESASKEEVASMMAHAYVVLQIQKDLGGGKWYQYDKQYREWAAATKKRVWGELNLSIYGRCLCTPAQPELPPPQVQRPPLPGKREVKKTKGKNKACFKHNFEGACNRSDSECYFDHSCWYCGIQDHTAGECPRAPKRPARDSSGR